MANGKSAKNPILFVIAQLTEVRKVTEINSPCQRDHSELILLKLKNTPSIILVSTDKSKTQPFKRHFDL